MTEAERATLATRLAELEAIPAGTRRVKYDGREVEYDPALVAAEIARLRGLLDSTGGSARRPMRVVF